MVADGASVREVAMSQDVSTATAYRRIAAAKAKLPAGNAELWRAKVDAEIDAVKARAWALVADPPHIVSAGRQTDVTDGQVVISALNTILKALERQSKLRGLDAPSRQTVAVVDNRVVEEAIAVMEEQLARTVEGNIVDGPPPLGA